MLGRNLSNPILGQPVTKGSSRRATGDRRLHWFNRRHPVRIRTDLVQQVIVVSQLGLGEGEFCIHSFARSSSKCQASSTSLGERILMSTFESSLEGLLERLISEDRSLMGVQQ